MVTPEMLLLIQSEALIVLTGPFQMPSSQWPLHCTPRLLGHGHQDSGQGWEGLLCVVEQASAAVWPGGLAMPWKDQVLTILQREPSCC